MSSFDSQRELGNDHQELEQMVAQRTAELSAANAQLRTLTAKLLQAQDQERRRLARDLHDTAGQILAALAANLGEIEVATRETTAPLPALVRQTQALVQQLTAEIRTACYLLHPPLLEVNGLANALTSYVKGFTERSRVKTTLDISENFERLTSDLELTIFRIVQESLTNAYRHSGASHASILLLRTARNITLQIEDDGRGMSRETLAAIHNSETGVGISGMRERIRHLGGKMKIDSSGSGTRILAAIPLLQKPFASVQNDVEPLQAAS